MVDTVIPNYSTTQVTMDGFDSLIVLSTGQLVATTTPWTMTGDRNRITIAGEVVTTNNANLGDGAGNSLHVTTTGNFYKLGTGGTTIVIDSDQSVLNDGMISGPFGVLVMGTGLAHNNGTITGTFPGTSADYGSGVLMQEEASLSNTGTINGTGAGVAVGYEGASDGAFILNTGVIVGNSGVLTRGDNLEIVNWGQILGRPGQGDGIESEGDFLTVKNNGTISGSISAFGLDNLVVNRGIIEGDLDFIGTGADRYDGKNAGVVTGDILGGDGDDVLLGGNDTDTMVGGSNNDVMRGRLGEDDLKGGSGNDKMWGGAGDDTLNGGSGQDDLTGGTGDDEMTGGGGADRFIFGLQSGNDVITDFQNNLDVIDLRAYGIANTAELTAAGAIQSATGGSIIDLTLVGGDGKIFVEGMNVGDWNNADFLF